MSSPSTTFPSGSPAPFSVGVPRWSGVEARGSTSQPGSLSWPCSSAVLQAGAASSGTRALRLGIAWWLKRIAN